MQAAFTQPRGGWVTGPAPGGWAPVPGPRPQQPLAGNTASSVTAAAGPGQRPLPRRRPARSGDSARACSAADAEPGCSVAPVRRLHAGTWGPPSARAARSRRCCSCCCCRRPRRAPRAAPRASTRPGSPWTPARCPRGSTRPSSASSSTGACSPCPASGASGSGGIGKRKRGQCL